MSFISREPTTQPLPHSINTEQEEGGHEDGDETIRAPPINLLQELQNPSLSNVIPLQSSLTDELGFQVQTEVQPTPLDQNIDSFFTDSRTSITGLDGLYGWETDPLPPDSLIEGACNNQALPPLFVTSGPVVDTLQEHQERRGHVRAPDPTYLNMFSFNNFRNRPSSRASTDDSETSTAWSLSSNIPQDINKSAGQGSEIIVRKLHHGISQTFERPIVLSMTERTATAHAQAILSVEVLTLCAFPSSMDKEKFANEAYMQAFIDQGLFHNGVSPTPSKEAMKSTRATYGVVRRALRKLCDEKVPLLYALVLTGTPSLAEQKNHITQEVSRLLKDDTYMKSNNDDSIHSAHPALYEITRLFCYNPRNGLARGHDKHFGPYFPLNFIALAFTAICCILESYKSGERKTVAFSHTNYSPKFNAILEGFKRTANGTDAKRRDKLRLLQKQLFELRLDGQELNSTRNNAESFLDSDDESQNSAGNNGSDK